MHLNLFNLYLCFVVLPKEEIKTANYNFKYIFIFARYSLLFTDVKCLKTE